MFTGLAIIVLLQLAGLRVDAATLATLNDVIIANEINGSPIANVEVADQAFQNHTQNDNVVTYW